MQEQAVAGNSDKEINKAFAAVMVPVILVLLGWAAVFHQGLVTAVTIWYNSDIFNHCLFVIPGTFFLIYLKRKALLAQPIKPNYWVAVLILPAIVLYGVGLAGDVQLFMHAAMFGLLPVLIWMVLGNKAAWQILFPLVFILFCIPVGEELVPYLQQIAARFSVDLLELSGIPVFRSGLYIEIPKGRFLVAEACSGISFFIASLVIGCLYAYLNMYSPQRRTLFVLLSVIFPIAANIIRVYGIILIAHLSDMQYAVGADHLIYGWFFFAFVIVCLIGLGELLREKVAPQRNDTELTVQPVSPLTAARGGLISAGVILLAAAGWYQFIASAIPDKQVQQFEFANDLKAKPLSEDEVYWLAWKAKFRSPTQERYWQESTPYSGPLTVYQAFYTAGGPELVSSLNRLYDQDRWTRVEVVSTDIKEPPFSLELVSSPNGQLRLIASWYVLDNASYASKQSTKFHQIATTLAGKPAHGGVVIVTMEVEQRLMQEQQQWFIDKVSKEYKALSEQAMLSTQ
jgi:exosortase A